MAFAEVNGTKLYYTIAGEENSLPILIMHGGLGLDHVYLIESLTELPKKYKVIFFDYREHGRSEHTDKLTFTFEQLADDADALREYMGLEKWVVLGHSAGGWIAQYYARKYQNNLIKLILSHTSSEKPGNYTEEMNQLIVGGDKRNAHYYEKNKGVLEDDDGAGDLRVLLNAIWYRYFYIYSEELDKLKDQIMESTILRDEALAYQDMLLEKMDIQDWLSEVKIETLILSGRHDFICPLTQGQILHDLLPNSKLEIFEKSGHFSVLEEPEKFYQVIDDFLDQELSDTKYYK